MSKRKQRPERRRTPPDREQKQIAKEVSAAALKRKIARLRQLPDDFRDLVDDSKGWEDYAELTGHRKDMEKWWQGPVLCLRELDKSEQRFFKRQELHKPWNGMQPKTFFGLIAIIDYANDRKCSWVYAPEYDRGLISALNIVLSRLKMPLRFRGQIMSAHTGKALGVVY